MAKPYDVHRSVYQFLEPGQWQEAAVRFLELEEKIDELEREDAEINHETQFGDFESCDICEQMHALIERRKGFAEKFAPIWAREALRLEREKREGR